MAFIPPEPPFTPPLLDDAALQLVALAQQTAAANQQILAVLTQQIESSQSQTNTPLSEISSKVQSLLTRCETDLMQIARILSQFAAQEIEIQTVETPAIEYQASVDAAATAMQPEFIPEIYKAAALALAGRYGAAVAAVLQALGPLVGDLQQVATELTGLLGSQLPQGASQALASGGAALPRGGRLTPLTPEMVRRVFTKGNLEKIFPGRPRGARGWVHVSEDDKIYLLEQLFGNRTVAEQVARSETITFSEAQVPAAERLSAQQSLNELETWRTQQTQIGGNRNGLAPAAAVVSDPPVNTPVVTRATPGSPLVFQNPDPLVPDQIPQISSVKPPYSPINLDLRASDDSLLLQGQGRCGEAWDISERNRLGMLNQQIAQNTTIVMRQYMSAPPCEMCDLEYRWAAVTSNRPFTVFYYNEKGVLQKTIYLPNSSLVSAAE